MLVLRNALEVELRGGLGGLTAASALANANNAINRTSFVVYFRLASALISRLSTITIKSWPFMTMPPPSPPPDVDESSPLLASPAAPDRQSAEDTPRWKDKLPAYYKPLAYSLAFTLAANFGSAIVNAPEIRLLETAVCRDYYRVHDPSVIGPPPLSYVDEQLCKVEEIQSELAYLIATKWMLGTLPGANHRLTRLQAAASARRSRYSQVFCSHTPTE
jgi:hypothetical protein